MSVPSSSTLVVFLVQEHIDKAVSASEDNGETIDLSQRGFNAISDEGVGLLRRAGGGDEEEGGKVKRIAMTHVALRELPISFSTLMRLRYLNMRGNLFTTFPEVLTSMPSLEILDISRNKIKRLPVQPGNLVHLRVLCMSKNRLQRLPRYLTYFSCLKILKVDSNPIVWPPAEVVNSLQDNGDMEDWIAEVKQWMEENGPDEAERVPTGRLNTRTDDVLEASMLERTASEMSMSMTTDTHRFMFSPSAPHTRNASEESTLSFSIGSETTSRPSPRPPPLRLPAIHSARSSPSGTPDVSTQNLSGYDFALTPPASALPQLHGRGQSYSVGRRPRAQTLGAKKSLPELRTNNYGFPSSLLQSTRSRTKGVTGDTPAVPVPRLKSTSPLATPEARFGIPGELSSSAVRSGANAPCLALEKNSYFRRLSTLPPLRTSRTVPDSLLKVMDGVRTILSAAEQIYDSLRHYTVYAIDDRLAGMLVRVLEPAGAYIGRLINALDRFDSVSRKGLPQVPVCRDVLKSCQDTLALFGRLTIVLQAQLKVLAGTDDVRFTRKLNLLLYGAAGEVSYAWQEMSPYLQDIKAYLQTGSETHLSKAHARDGPMTPVIEQGEMGDPTVTPHADRSFTSTSHTPNPPSIQARRARRHGGSYSQKDVELGKALPSAGLIPSPDTPNWPTSANQPPALRSALRHAAQAHSPSPVGMTSPLLWASTQAPHSASHHSRRESDESSGHTTSPPMNGARPTRPILTPSNSSAFLSHHLQTPSPLPRSPLPLPPDSAQLFDGALLSMMDSATETANNVWAMLAELLNNLAEPRRDIRAALSKAEHATEKVREDLEAVRQDPSPAARKALGDAAHQFAKSVAQLLTLIRAYDAQKALPSELRSGVSRLTHATKNFTVFFQATSFAPRLRALSPAGGDEESHRMPMLSQGLTPRGTPTSLLRSRSDVATPSKPSLSKSVRDAPWSAQPQQTFQIPPVPPRQVESATRPTFEALT
ncbi:hypothetical protein DACRYDRAFT_104040 [Dacryopinax primogenitus]|uniref:L domain-like protein n=1 Tax=Dacryopinax primogenitus (strain DJM 731) TaxID=1858805 RepID=M5G9R8_DACPD|nr:uncharacterized protein DACRYDRAFT_104040 [Dacryopinax primogenitus]EJU05554.1 hypothetical protein DACRYDRAFT_104040 [Dacryopinax primogenitus]